MLFSLLGSMTFPRSLSSTVPLIASKPGLDYMLIPSLQSLAKAWRIMIYPSRAEEWSPSKPVEGKCPNKSMVLMARKKREE